MAETKKRLCLVLNGDLGEEVYGYMSPNKKRKRNPEGGMYYLSCCYLGLWEEFDRLRKMHPTKDSDALQQAAAGGHLGLVKHMISLGIHDHYHSHIESACENNRQEVLEFLVNHEEKWFTDQHSTEISQKKKYKDFVDHCLYLGACTDNEFLVRFALTRDADELDEAENVALQRNNKVAKIISDHI